MAVSYLERLMDALIEEEKLPTPIREFRLTPERRWRCDYVWITDKIKLILEVEGAVWTKSRHTTGKGFTADCEKYNEAALLGFTVLRVTKYHLISGQAIEWVKRALGI